MVLDVGLHYHGYREALDLYTNLVQRHNDEHAALVMEVDTGLREFSSGQEEDYLNLVNNPSVIIFADEIKTCLEALILVSTLGPRQLRRVKQLRPYKNAYKKTLPVVATRMLEDVQAGISTLDG